MEKKEEQVNEHGGQLAYPVLIATDGRAYSVYVPDWGIYTKSRSLEDSVSMAKEAVCLKGELNRDFGKPFPKPTTCEEAAERKGKEPFGINGCMLTEVFRMMEFSFAPKKGPS